VNATLRQARNRARGVASLRDHEFIAELQIPEGANITFERRVLLAVITPFGARQKTF